MTASMTDIQIFSNPQFGEIRITISEIDIVIKIKKVQ